MGLRRVWKQRPRTTFPFLKLYKKKKEKHFSHHHDEKRELKEKREDLLRLTNWNFFEGSVAPLTPGAVVQSAAYLDRVSYPRSDAVQAKAGLFAWQVFLQLKKKMYIYQIFALSPFYSCWIHLKLTFHLLVFSCLTRRPYLRVIQPDLTPTLKGGSQVTWRFGILSYSSTRTVTFLGA